MLEEDFITAILGLRDFQVIDGQVEEDGSVMIDVQLKWAVAVCPRCGRASGSVLEYVPRLTRDLSMSGRRVYLSYVQRRFRCYWCERSFVERLESIDCPGARYTKRYEDWVVDQVNQSTIEAVSNREGMCWETVKHILERVAQRNGLLKPPSVVRWIAFDEIALKKRHKQYVLVISAPEEGRILSILPGRTKEELSRWLETTWTEWQRQQVEMVTIDMWDGYFYAALEKLPQAVIAIDRFHVEKNLLEAITKLRRQIQKNLPEADKQALKGTRWLLVSNYDDLDEDKRRIVDEALDRCPELALCHYVKEELRDWYEEDHDVESASRKLEAWKELASSLGSRAMNNFIKTMDNWREWILNYFIERATNGFAEGINNALQLLKRKAYGFRNFANFRLRALLLHAIP
jgi:transposase